MLRLAFIIATFLTASTAAATPKIYTYLDAPGQRHYTDVPDNNRYRLLVLSHNDRTASGDRYDFQVLAKATQYDSIIEHAAVSAAVEPNLLRAVIVVESGFNSRAVSQRGAVGLMQPMPATASHYGVVNRFDARQNVHGAAPDFNFLIERFRHDVRLPLGAYTGANEAGN